MGGADLIHDEDEAQLPLLFRAESVAGMQRSGDPYAGNRIPVASGTERRSDAPEGNRGKPSESVVDLPGRACLESGGLFPHGQTEMRLPGLRRPGASENTVFVLVYPGNAYVIFAAFAADMEDFS